ncbi:hypothetical protein OPIT5_08240 [Opitutaceae bacterium TAV5]|nr:hypothetical protein OPIT5_08240 [Opitutaceae bacterium TAV5]
MSILPSVVDSYSLASAGSAAQTGLAAPLRFAVPLIDADEVAMQLKPKARHDLTLTLRILEKVHALRGGQRDFVAQVHALAAGYRHIRGLSATRLLAKYYAFIEAGGNWRVLVKNYKSPSKQPAEFVSFLQGLIEQNHRSVSAAIDKLLEILWPEGAEIPGYGTWQNWFARTYPDQAVPARFPRVYPAGWTRENLRRYAPSRAHRKMFQQGLAAAHAHLPKIIRDTSRLKPMEWIVIDDFQLDCYCAFPGDPELGYKPQVAPVGGILAMDVASRKVLARIIGPLITRKVKQPDGTEKEVRFNVRSVHAQALLYQVFETHGIPDYPVTIICENKTATILPAVELMLSSISENRIRVHRTSLIEHKTLPNGFVERGGAPWEKGWIESGFNARWNLMGDMKGYKGSNERLNGPANMEAMKEYFLKLVAYGEGVNKLNLPPEVIARLRTPFPFVAEVEKVFDFVTAWQEQRTNHRCLGFDTVREYYWPTPKLPAPGGIDAHGPNSPEALACLTPEQQCQMVPDERKESRLERWERLSAMHMRRAFPASALKIFMLSPVKATWINHAVQFSYEKKPYSYIDDDGVMAGVPERTDVLAYVDFQVPARALVMHLDGRMLGILRLFGDDPRGVSVTDEEAIREQKARRAIIVHRIMGEIQDRPLHQAANEELAADRAHNDAVVARWKVGTAELTKAERVGAAMGEAAQGAAEQAEEAKAVAKVDVQQLLARRAARAEAEKQTHPAASNDDASWV